MSGHSSCITLGKDGNLSGPVNIECTSRYGW